MYFAQRPIFEHSVSGIGNLPSHVLLDIELNTESPRLVKFGHYQYQLLDLFQEIQ